MNKPLTVFFGGTFDPIHYGHILPATQLTKELGIAKISLLPNHIPPHKPQPEATTAQRLEMLTLVINEYPELSIDMREIVKADLTRPSYTIETLQAWREENGNNCGLAFILGQDSLLSLPTWHNWQTLLDYCHLIICRRPGYPDTITDPELKAWVNQHQTTNIADLHHYPHGFIYFANTPLEDISATTIRERISHQQNCETLLPNKILHYIQDQHLYGA